MPASTRQALDVPTNIGFKQVRGYVRIPGNIRNPRIAQFSLYATTLEHGNPLYTPHNRFW
jgi:hypothetical protein